MVRRRRFLWWTGSGLVACATAGVWPGESWGSEGYDVLYYDWIDDREQALDHLAELEEGVLSPEASRRLEMVGRKGGRYGVITRLGGPRHAAEALARDHAARIRDFTGAEEELARAVPETAHHRLYNVSYGLGPNFEVLKSHWDVVARMLGPGVARRLFVERTDAGNYALVYKRYGDVQSTARVARRHDALLRRTGLDASFIQERNNEVVWDGSSNPTAGAEELARRSELLEEIREEVQEEPPEAPPEAAAEAPAEAPPEGEPPAAEPEVPAEGEEPTGVPPEAEPGAVDTGAAGEGGAPDGYALLPGRTELQDDINTYVKGLRRKGQVASNEQTSWMVYDLLHDRTVAVINGNAPRQCASMVKPLVMLAFFSEVERGRFIYGSRSRANLEAMIQRSSNASTNWVIDQVGSPSRVQGILDARFPGLCPHSSIVEKIAAGGRTYRNRASVSDYARLLRALWHGRLPHAEEMKRIMNLPGRDRIYDGTSIPVGTLVYNKTGSTARLCGDMGILVVPTEAGGQHPYVFAGVIEKTRRTSAYGSWIRARSQVIRGVSDLTYTFMKARYGLK